MWAGGREAGEDAGEESQRVGQLGSRGSVRLWVLLRARWAASGGPGEVAWSDFCERSLLALGFRLDLDKGCGSGEHEERGYI